MKKILYFLPLFIYAIFLIVILISSLDFINIGFIAICYVLELLESVVILYKNIWQGGFLGIFCGAILMFSDFINYGQIVIEWLIGLIVCVYYIMCMIICYKDKKRKEN